MQIKSIIYRLVISISVFGIGALFLVFFLLDRSLKTGCAEIKSIAEDQQKIIYLNNWVDTTLLDKGFYNVSGMHGNITGFSLSGFTDIQPLPDEINSGIPIPFLRIYTDKVAPKYKAELTAQSVSMIAIGYGRNQVILVRNNNEVSSYRGDKLGSKKLLKINRSTYVYCADSKFEI